MTRSMRSVATVTALALAATMVFQVGSIGVAAAGNEHADDGPVLTRGAFHDEMRKLWEDHVTWTRLYIVSAATGPTDLPDIAATTERLLANQTHIGDAIKPFYGVAAGDALTALLRDHILTAAEIIAEAKAGEADALDEAVARWYVNGDEIAAFLSAANPDHWPIDDMTSHMTSHLDLTLAEAVARLEGRHDDEVEAYDAVHADILEMADMLSDGIIAQFPESFG